VDRHALDTDSMRRFGPDDGVLDTDIMTCSATATWCLELERSVREPLRGDLAKFPPTLVVVARSTRCSTTA